MNTLSRSMLVIDDENGILKMIKEVFSKRGWEVLTDPTGISGMETLKEKKVDLILLDICLPDGSGIDILKDIHKKYPDIGVIIMTGIGYDEDIVESTLEFGASGYIGKGDGVIKMIDIVNEVAVKMNI